MTQTSDRSGTIDSKEALRLTGLMSIAILRRILDKYWIIELRGIPSIISALCSRCRRVVYQGISDIQSPSSECPEMSPTMSIIYFFKFSGLECRSEWYHAYFQRGPYSLTLLTPTGGQWTDSDNDKFEQQQPTRSRPSSIYNSSMLGTASLHPLVNCWRVDEGMPCSALMNYNLRMEEGLDLV